MTSPHQQYDNIERDVLVVRANDYADDVFQVMRPMLQIEHNATPVRSDADVARVISDVYTFAVRISVEVQRAVAFVQLNETEGTQTDPVQNESNGAAKAAILAIAQSIVSWEIIQQAAIVDAGLVKYLVETARHIGIELCERFPLAMGFHSSK